MVKFNPGLSQILNKVFSSKNMQLKLTEDCWAFTPRHSNDTIQYNTRIFSEVYLQMLKRREFEEKA